MDVQTAPFESLCGCVAVMLSTSECFWMDRLRPAQAKAMTEELIRVGNRDRHPNADCEKCGGSGLIRKE